MADTPQDSGEPLGDVVVVGSVAGSLDNLPKSSLTSDTGGTTTEYDQAILFIHGIGDQKPGDTFKAMVNPLEKEWEKDGLKIEALNNKSKKGQVGKKSPLVESDIQLSGAYSKKVALREVYWHGEENDFSTMPPKKKFRSRLKKIKLMQKATRKRYLKYISNKFLPCLIDNILIIVGVIQILLLKLLQFRLSTIALILVSVFFLSDFNSINRLSQDGGNETNMDKAYDALYPLISLIIWPTILVFILYKFTKIRKLYRQIKSCAMGSNSAQVDKVSKDIMNILNKSKSVLIVAHSMGGYLSHEALSRDSIREHLESEKDKHISLCGLGSGLGPMLVIKKYKKSNLFAKFVFPVFLLLAFFLYVALWINLWVNLIVSFIDPTKGARIFYFNDWKFSASKKINVDIINLSYELTTVNPVHTAILCVILLVIFRFLILIPTFKYYNSKELNFNSLDKNNHREFYYVSDFVGNTSRYAYPKGVGQEMLGNPFLSTGKNEKTQLYKILLGIVIRRFFYSHDAGYYFKSTRLINFLKECSLSGVNPKTFSAKDYKPFCLWGVYCVALLGGTWIFYSILKGNQASQSTLIGVTIIYFPLIIFCTWIVYCLGYVAFHIIALIELKILHRFPCLERSKNSNMVAAVTAVDEDLFPAYLLFQFMILCLIPPFFTVFYPEIFNFFNPIFKALILFAFWILLVFISFYSSIKLSLFMRKKN